MRFAAFTLASLTALAGASLAGAQVIVSPNTLAATEGNGRLNSAPFNNISRYQQIYDAAQFSTLTGPQLITQIAFRPDSSQAAAFSHTIPSIQFDLSTTGVAVSALSSNFAGNVGANDTVVYNGALTFTTTNTLGAGTAKQFDLIVNLTTPFLYNPGAGNLLLDIRNFSAGFTGFVDAASDSSASPQIRLNFVDNSTTTPTGLVQSAGAVTQFTFQSASVPEPGSVALLVGMGISGAGFLVRRRRGAGKAV